MTLSLLAVPLLVLAQDVAPLPQEPASSSIPTGPAIPARAASNALFAEALGNGLLYSINYERFFDSWNIGLRAGASYFSFPVSSYDKSGNLKLASFPLVASYYYGTPKHKLQLGLGGTLIYLAVSTDSTGTKFDSGRAGAAIAVTGVVGYRYLPPDGGFTFGAGFTPLLRSGSFLPWGGANAGYVF